MAKSNTKVISTYQGVPCRKGHSGVRYASNGHCIECSDARNKRYYYTKKAKQTYMGKPCKQGHNGQRYVKNGLCVVCYKMRNLQVQRIYQGRPCKYGHSGKRYVSNRFCVECGNIKAQENIEHFLLYQKAWRDKLKDDPEYKQKNAERSRRWRKAHPHYRNPNAERNQSEYMAVRRNTIGLLYYEGYV